MTTQRTNPPANPTPNVFNEDIEDNKTILAKRIADEARDSISSYCMNICGAKCCKKGKLLLQSDEEVETIAGVENIGEFIENKTLEKTKNGFMTYDLEQNACRHLQENVFCSIHKSSKKPTICNDYPLFLTKKYVIASEQCPAVENGKLNEFIKQIQELGYKKF